VKTTLTLEKDVAAALERLRKARKVSLEQIVNEILRQGLARVSAAPAAPRARFRTPVLSLGRCLVGSVDNVAEVLGIAEGESLK
jgi:hypothetical protein